MFTELHVRNWKNFQQIHVRNLGARIFCVGPNASGKSNLLDVFRFLHDLCRTGGGFQSAVLNRGGVSKVRCLSARRHSDIEIDVRMDLKGVQWEYFLSFNQNNNQIPVIRHERVWRDGEMLLDRPTETDLEDPVQLTQTQLEQLTANRAFRDVANFLDSIEYLHIVPQLVREPERSVGRVQDPFGGDFLEQVAKTHQRNRDMRFRRIETALKVAVPQLEELKLDRDAKGTPHLFGRYVHWRKNAGWQTEDQFSDGTLRLLGLLWAMQRGSGPLLLEEPELSLHPAVIQRLPQMFAHVVRQRRQVIISTHSPDLLSDTGIRPEEVLVLEPSPEGTTVTHGSEDEAIRILVDSGATVADAVLPRTKPKHVEQISLFGADLP
ncbi:AAA family ATPase [Alicyclobacillus macrosporangiidus]|uniref:Predicted ATPase n=1 Tax=Alicyclobacillus macrosporangiidus TaxID=392015 RepID=A0A1I7HRV7_9BACL|nr:ATP-binding protein [Alicyclobacillus macrosporangiidus]SFU63427.1 Predicted ATPase [Alicyclobacillus macrosporangiidus]